MGKFKEWLREQAEQKRLAERNETLVREWTDAVENLFAQIMQWLREDDTEKMLTVNTSTVEKTEEGIGPYVTETLEISLSGQIVDLIPVAHNVVAGIGKNGDLGFRAEGRVDMTNFTRKYMLYRAVSESGKKWMMVDDETYAVTDLNKEAFESALQDLLT